MSSVMEPKIGTACPECGTFIEDESTSQPYQLDEATKQIFEQSMAQMIQHAAACIQNLQWEFTTAMIDQIREHTAAVNRNFNKPQS